MDIIGMTFTGGCVMGPEIGCDPYYSNVSLLLPMNGANGSTTFTDYSPSPKTITAFGNTQISTAQSVFEGGSVYFDGNGDYLIAPNSSVWAFGTADFTVEFWFYPQNTNNFFVDTRTGPTNSGGFSCSARANVPGDTLAVYVHPTGYAFNDLSTQMDQWNYVVFQRRSGILTAYLNGTLSANSYSVSTNFTNNQLTIGTNINNRNGQNQSVWWPLGYMDDLRITTGIARYTSSFTPPTQAFPTVSC